MKNNLAAYHADRDAGALAAAVALGMGNCLFGNLIPGESFTWKHADGEIFTAIGKGKYRDASGKGWKTGARTAVFRLPSCGQAVAASRRRGYAA